MKTYTIKSLYLVAMLVMGVRAAHAQAPGSARAYGGPMSTKGISTGGTDAELSETLYIGPGTYVIDGTWEIYSKYVVIDPAAVITGTGTIKFFNPSVAGGAASPTLIDGNAGTNAIGVNMELDNASGMQLMNINFPSDLTSAGFTNNTAASTVYAGSGLNLAVDGADITLGAGVAGDLRFDSDATISNYSPLRMVITNNSILSHVVKDAYSGSFTYPVGIADGDYTPVAISNSTANGFHVSVQNYTTSASDEAVGISPYGMDRTWNIYADAATGNSTINLQHNIGTNQSGFDAANHFVTRWSATSPNTTGDVPGSASAWQNNTPGAGTTGNLSTTGTIGGSSMLSRAYTTFGTTAAGQTAYYTKVKAVLTPNLAPTIAFLPSNIVGTQNVNLVVNVYEFNDVATTGPIMVFIPKTSTYILTYNPAATTLSGQTLQNSAWTFDGSSNPGFYIMNRNAVLPASGGTAFGFSTTYNPNSQVGATQISAIIAENSGGESSADSGDNTDDDILNYSF